MRRTYVNLSKCNFDRIYIYCVYVPINNFFSLNFDRICDYVGITSSFAPFDDLSPINVNKGLIINTFLYSTITKSVFILANIADPDETPRFAASHLGLRCLNMFLFRMHSACSTSAYYMYEMLD